MCSTVEDDGGLAVVCVVIGTEEVVPTEARADIIKNTQQGTWGPMGRVEVSEPVRWESEGGRGSGEEGGWGWRGCFVSTAIG